MATIIRKSEVRQRLEDIIVAVADDIEQYGADALWNDDQMVVGGQIIVDIDSDMVPEIRYVRRAYPTRKA